MKWSLVVVCFQDNLLRVQRHTDLMRICKRAFIISKSFTGSRMDNEMLASGGQDNLLCVMNSMNGYNVDHFKSMYYFQNLFCREPYGQ